VDGGPYVLIVFDTGALGQTVGGEAEVEARMAGRLSSLTDARDNQH
jgi:hypothetical protein